MKELIYYPNFESQNVVWLKFALLYVDTLMPIIPFSGERELSDLYRKLKSESDLLSIHRPEYEEGYESSLDAIDIVQRIMNAPQRFSNKLGGYNSIRHWRDPGNQEYKLFEEKYTDEWQKFCCQNKIGRQTNGGLLVSKVLGNIYMSVLANTIADRRGVSPITDKTEVDELSFFLKRKAPVQTNLLSNARSVIELKLPAQIATISFDDIIRVRSSENFIIHLRAFHTELENFYKNVEEGNAAEAFVKSYKGSLSDFSEHILSISLDTMTFGLGAWLLLNSPSYTETEFFKTIVLAGSGLVVKSSTSLKKTWKNTKTKRHCRRYLTKISKLTAIE